MRGALARGTMATAAMMTGKRTDATPPAGLHLPHPFMCILGRPQEPMQQDLSLLLEAAQCFHIMAARRGCCKLRHGRHKADREVCLEHLVRLLFAKSLKPNRGKLQQCRYAASRDGTFRDDQMGICWYGRDAKQSRPPERLKVHLTWLLSLTPSSHVLKGMCTFQECCQQRWQ